MSDEDNCGLSPCPYCGTVPRTKPHYFEELWNVECGNDACPWPDEHDPWATGYLDKDAAIASWNSIASCAVFFPSRTQGES